MTDLLDNPIPSTVEIGPHSYEIRTVETWEGLSRFGVSGSSVGCADHDKCVISIRSAASGEVSETQEMDTVLHEIVHAIIHALGFESRLKEDGDDSGEWFVGPFTTYLLDVIRRNPIVMGYLEGMNE